MAVIMKSIMLGQQGSVVSARSAGRELLGSTILGGGFAIVFWLALKLHPNLWMFFLWMLAFGIYFAGKIYAVIPTRLPASFWQNTCVTMLILVGPAVEDSASGKDVQEAFVVRTTLFIGVTLYAWARGPSARAAADVAHRVHRATHRCAVRAALIALLERRDSGAGAPISGTSGFGAAREPRAKPDCTCLVESAGRIDDDERRVRAELLRMVVDGDPPRRLKLTVAQIRQDLVVAVAGLWPSNLGRRPFDAVSETGGSRARNARSEYASRHVDEITTWASGCQRTDCANFGRNRRPGPTVAMTAFAARHRSQKILKRSSPR
jgi:hypothetical protein